MVSIVTYQASMLVQKNLSKNTNLLNQAIERMTTGFKVNGAKDNAANYSISQSMSSKISSYQVAEDNAMMGLDMVQTANTGLEQLTALSSRLRELAVQAQNGTYGTASLEAMNAEAQAILNEINRIKANTEYDGRNLLGSSSIASYMREEVGCEAGLKEASGASGASGGSGASGAGSYTLTTDYDGNYIFKLSNGFISDDSEDIIKPTASYDGFISDPTARDENGNVIDVSSLTRIERSGYHPGDIYSIYSKEDLQTINYWINQGAPTENTTFVLGADIDLSGEEWNPIGDASGYSFQGIFDGNGHKIAGLYIDNEEDDYQGLFGNVGYSGVIRNVGIEGAYVKGDELVGGLAGSTTGNITNCYVTGSVTGRNSTGGLVGSASGIKSCYSEADVNGKDLTGGLAGDSGYIYNSYATGNVHGASNTGGLAGSTGSIENSYATGSVTGYSKTGGITGQGHEITNSYATGTVTGKEYTGGLAGDSYEINNSYATGIVMANVAEARNTGGLAGYANRIYNSYATGGVTGDNNTGGLAGHAGSIYNSYATGTTNGVHEASYTGGLVGHADSIINSYATGTVTSDRNSYHTGGLAGYAWSINNSYATGDVTGYSNIGGLVGYGNAFQSYAVGSVTGDQYIGGLVGDASKVSECYAAGNVHGASITGGLAGMAGANEIADSYVIGKVTGEGCGIFVGSNQGHPNIEGGGYNEEVNQGMPLVGNYSEYTADLTKITISGSGFECTLQVGINGDSGSQISFTSSAPKTSLNSIITNGIEAEGTIELIDTFMRELYNSQTSLGAVENRLNSAIESIGVSYNNLVSSRSTLRDADIAKESSSYIKAQILQQAAATLMATANQNPSIALQLI